MKILLPVALAMMLAGCALRNTGGESRPTPTVDPTTILNKREATVKELREAIAAAEIEMKNLKLKLKQVMTAKLQREFYIAAAVFGILAVLAGAIAWFFPLMRKSALKAVVFCGIAAAGCAVAARLTPYRTWILVGVSVAVVLTVAGYSYVHRRRLANATLP